MSCYWQDALDRNAGRTVTEAEWALKSAWIDEFNVQAKRIGAEYLSEYVFPERHTPHVNIIASYGDGVLCYDAKGLANVTLPVLHVHPRTAAQALAAFATTLREDAA